MGGFASFDTVICHSPVDHWASWGVSTDVLAAEIVGWGANEFCQFSRLENNDTRYQNDADGNTKR